MSDPGRFPLYLTDANGTVYLAVPYLAVPTEPAGTVPLFVLTVVENESEPALPGPDGGSPAAAVGPGSGAADREPVLSPGQGGGSTSNSNRPGTLNPEAAVGATELARSDGS